MDSWAGLFYRYACGDRGGTGQNFAENRWFLVETSAPALPYTLGAIGLAGFTHVALNATDKQRARAAERGQQEVRDAVGEPVDVFTTGRGDEQATTLRWYGADNAKVDATHELTRRLRTVGKFAETHGVDSVALSADWVNGALGGDMSERDESDKEAQFAALQPYGDVRPGKSYISDELKTTKKLNDLKSDDHVLVSSAEQLEALIEQLEERADGTLIRELIYRTKDGFLIGKYEESKRTEGSAANKAAHGALLQALRQRLEGHLSADGSEVYRERTPDGAPIRGRASSFQIVSGESINKIMTPLHDPDQSVFESSSLLGRYGVRDIEELVRSIIGAEGAQSGAYVEKATAAAYLLALRRDTRLHERNGNANGQSAKSSDQPRTFFQRLADKKDIERQRRPNVRRKLASAALAIGAFVAPLGATTAIDHVPGWVHDHKEYVVGDVDKKEYDAWYQGLTQEQQDDFLTGVEIGDKFKAHKYAQDYPVHASLGDAALDFMQFEDNLSVGTAKVFVDLFGNVASSSIAPSFADMAKSEWFEELFKNLPSGLYIEEGEQAGAGDVESDGNKAVYSVESLDGTPVTGYWHAATFNERRVDSSGIYYWDFHQSDIVDIPGQAKSVEELNAGAAIRVSTPYLSLLGSSSKQLPILDGMALAGVRVVDADDPSRVYVPGRMRVPEDTDVRNLTLAGISKEGDGMWEAGIRKPTLVYWLEPSDGSFDAYGKQFTVSRDRKQSLMEAGEGFDDISVAAREAFGLKPDASIEELVGAIQAKEYSLTPLADAGLTSLVKYDPEKSDYEMLTEAAETLGGLKSYNCNLASTSFLLMLAAEDIKKYNYVTGFLNGVDGDNSTLSTDEAHAWLMDSDNEIIDPTPIGGENISPREPEGFSDDTASRLDARDALAVGAAGIGSLVSALALWKNRRRIQDGAQRVRTAAEKRRVRRVERHTLTPAALEVIQQALWGGRDPHEIDWSTAHVQGDRVTERLGSLGELNDESVDRVEQALKNPTLTPATRRAVRRAIRTSGVARKNAVNN